MLKRLRMRIVATLVAVSALVLTIAFAAIMAITYTSSSAAVLREIEGAVERGPQSEIEFVIGMQGTPGSSASSSNAYMPVALAAVSDDGEVVAHNREYAYMDDEYRATALQVAIDSEASSGLIVDARVFYLRCDIDGGYLVAFADASSVIVTMDSAMKGTAVVFLLVLAALTCISVALTYAITKPVQKAWDSQAMFIADASHELKTPLTVILANTDILKRRPETLDEDQLKWVDGIRSESQRMKKLVEDMLFLARNEIPARGTETAKETIDLSNLVSESSLAFDAVAFEAGVDLVTDVREGAVVKGDRVQIERLVKSLLDNAVKYAGAEGRVTVRLDAKRKDHAVLTVNNTGDPIPADELPHVFDRFWRSERARSSSQGGSFGLGLSIAKSIAEGQGATISVASDREKGTTFTVAF